MDKRDKSNSIVFAPALTITPDELLAEAQTRFLRVFGRLPQAVRLKGPTTSCRTKRVRGARCLGRPCTRQLCSAPPTESLGSYYLTTY